MNVVMLTPAHWVYLLGIITIVITMIRRTNVVAPAMVATFATVYAMTGDLTKSVEAFFYGPLTAAKTLFDIFLVISLMTAFMNSLRVMQSDTKMVQPFRRVMVNADAAFIILAVISYAMALFFWPTPSIPIIAGILLPAAIYAGVPPMAAAVCIAIAGLGTALSSDYVIKVAPGISAKMANVPLTDVADKALVLSLITGLTAFVISYVRLRSRFTVPSASNLVRWEDSDVNGLVAAKPSAFRGIARASISRLLRNGPKLAAVGAPIEALDTHPPLPGALRERSELPAHGLVGGGPSGPGNRPVAEPPRLTRRQAFWSSAFAMLTPAVFLGIVVYMVLPKLVPSIHGVSGAAAAAFVGGAAGFMLILAATAFDHRNMCRHVAGHITDGFVFSFRAMGSVLPIAGFFFIGVATTVGPIVGLPDGAAHPALLADLVRAGEAYTPHSPVFAAFSILLSGMVTGIDGSGFAGLPLTGALSGALGRSIGLDVSTLAAIGQMGSVWTGKTLCAWSALASVASFARVPVLNLVGTLLVPVVTGLCLATMFAVLYW